VLTNRYLSDSTFPCTSNASPIAPHAGGFAARSYRDGSKIQEAYARNLSDWSEPKIEALRRVLRDEAVAPTTSRVEHPATCRMGTWLRPLANCARRARSAAVARWPAAAPRGGAMHRHDRGEDTRSNVQTRNRPRVDDETASCSLSQVSSWVRSTNGNSTLRLTGCSGSRTHREVLARQHLPRRYAGSLRRHLDLFRRPALSPGQTGS